jgi:hypothetical protein
LKDTARFFAQTLALSVGAALALTSRPVSAAPLQQQADTEAAAFGKPVAGLLWGVSQLIPSPLMATDGHVVQGGMRWQLTPLLYSFGVAARPWRSFVVAPMARLSSSLELFVSPEWTCCAAGDRDGFVARAGLRSYVPLLGHGETLALSLGGAYWRHTAAGGPSFDVGLHTLFGTLGLVATASPGLAGRQFSLALAIRYF